MGFQSQRFYFKQELPLVSTIKIKFKEITGLDLVYHPCLQLNELSTEMEDALYSIEKSVYGSFQQVFRRPYFVCEGFQYVYLGDYMSPESMSFYLECPIKIECMYFFEALSKTMLELGANIIEFNVDPHEENLNVDDYLEPYHPYERKWKNIKKWNDMSKTERAFFRSYYVKNRENGN